MGAALKYLDVSKIVAIIPNAPTVTNMDQTAHKLIADGMVALHKSWNA
jgi:hypothetical protein